MTCPRCHARETYTRQAISKHGIALESWCVCGWSFPWVTQAIHRGPLEEHIPGDLPATRPDILPSYPGERREKMRAALRASWDLKRRAQEAKRLTFKLRGIQRRCSHCGQQKPLALGFYVDKTCKGGYRPECKECKLQEVRQRRRASA